MSELNSIALKILSNGKGSLLYSLGNIKVLSLIDKNLQNKSPLSFIEKLELNHPYKIIGEENVKKSIEWFYSLGLFRRLKLKVAHFFPNIEIYFIRNYS